MKQLSVLLGGAALAMAMASTAFANPNDLYGEPVESTAATKVINVDHDTSYVNVTGGDVVKFVIRGNEYTWDFDTASNVGEVDLNALLPAGTLHHVVKVYVARDPTYSGGA